MPGVLVFFGLIASGKSTLAARFAAGEQLLYLNTDRVRKELAGLEATQRRPAAPGQGIYSREFTKRTHATMLERTVNRLRQGSGVVLDGSYSRRKDRANVLACGRQQGAIVRFILCYCSDSEVKRRLEMRARDPLAVSDGRWDIYLKQKESFEPPDELKGDQLLLLDTEADPDVLLRQVRQWLGATSDNSKI